MSQGLRLAITMISQIHITQLKLVNKFGNLNSTKAIIISLILID